MLSPRVHNVVSYSSTLLLLPIICLVSSKDGILERNTRLGIALWLVHFARRTLESALVHEYSKASISILDTVGEYAYYWIFGAWTAIGLSTGSYALPAWASWIGLCLFAVGETLNSAIHFQLASLRKGKSASKTRRFLPSKSPRCSFIFRYVSCPHYCFEVISWVGFNLACGLTWGGVLFTAVGAIIVSAYALERHEGYKKQDDAYIVPYAIFFGIL